MNDKNSIMRASIDVEKAETLQVQEGDVLTDALAVFLSVKLSAIFGLGFSCRRDRAINVTSGEELIASRSSKRQILVLGDCLFGQLRFPPRVFSELVAVMAGQKNVRVHAKGRDLLSHMEDNLMQQIGFVVGDAVTLAVQKVRGTTPQNSLRPEADVSAVANSDDWAAAKRGQFLALTVHVSGGFSHGTITLLLPSLDSLVKASVNTPKYSDARKNRIQNQTRRKANPSPNVKNSAKRAFSSMTRPMRLCFLMSEPAMIVAAVLNICSEKKAFRYLSELPSENRDEIVQLMASGCEPKPVFFLILRKALLDLVDKEGRHDRANILKRKIRGYRAD
jgi:hypothetical protein